MSDSDFVSLSDYWRGDGTAVSEGYTLVGGHGADRAWSTVAWQGEPKPVIVSQCAATTKEGKACKGSGKPWCAGHASALRARGLDPATTIEWPA